LRVRRSAGTIATCGVDAATRCRTNELLLDLVRFVMQVDLSWMSSFGHSERTMAKRDWLEEERGRRERRRHLIARLSLGLLGRPHRTSIASPNE
jgi:hypothetical protein